MPISPLLQRGIFLFSPLQKLIFYLIIKNISTWLFGNPFNDNDNDRVEKVWLLLVAWISKLLICILLLTLLTILRINKMLLYKSGKVEIKPKMCHILFVKFFKLITFNYKHDLNLWFKVFVFQSLQANEKIWIINWNSIS